MDSPKQSNQEKFGTTNWMISDNQNPLRGTPSFREYLLRGTAILILMIFSLWLPINSSAATISAETGNIVSLSIRDYSSTGANIYNDELNGKIIIRSYSWTSSNESATTWVDKSKKSSYVKFSRAGTYTINYSMTYSAPGATKSYSFTAQWTVKITESGPTGISVSTYKNQIYIGESTTVSANIYGGSGSVTWTKSNNNVYISGSGTSCTVTGQYAGTSRITGTTNNGYSDYVNITILEHNKVVVTPSSLNIHVGDSETLSASITGSNSSTCNWRSSNSNVVKVSQSSGKTTEIVATGIGSAQITATAYDGTSASCYVTVTESGPTGISVSSSKNEIYIGESATVSAELIGGTGSVIWTKSNNNVLISGSGTSCTVTGQTAGISRITGTTNNGHSDYVDITILEHNTILVTPSSLNIRVGDKETLSASITGSNSSICNWMSSNPNVVKVSQSSGKTTEIVATGVGSAQITTTAYDGTSASCYVTVTERGPSGISVSTSKSQIYIGESATVSAELIGGTGSVTWTANNSNVSISGNGTSCVVTGLFRGTSRITATTNNGLSDYVDIAIWEHNKIVVTPSSLNIHIGDRETLSASITGSNSTICNWDSSNPNVVKVSQSSGKTTEIVATGVGTAQVTATAYDGTSASCYVTVTERGPSGISVSTSKNEIYIGESATVSAELIGGTGSVTWTANNSNVSISGAGNSCVVTGLFGGTSRITATTNNGHSDYVDITILQHNKVVVTPSSLNIHVGDKETLSASITGSNSSTCTWKSSNPNVVKVSSSSGKTVEVVATGVGTAQVTATAYDGISASCYVEVTDDAGSFVVNDVTYTILNNNSVGVETVSSQLIYCIIPKTISHNNKEYSVVSVEDDAFYQSNVTSVILPETVTEIKYNAFSESSLASIILPQNLKTIGEFAFYQAKLTSIVIPDGVTEIAPFTFSVNRNLVSVILPATLKKIGDDAFAFTALTSIVIPPTCTEIGMGAFGSCYSLTSIEIPSLIKKIDNSAFSFCWGLREVTYLSENPCIANPNIFEEEVYQNATLNIPFGSTAKYKSITPWNKFKNIKEITLGGIEEVVVDNDGDIDYSEPYEIYNLSGMLVGRSIKELINGVYIVRQGATVNKIVVK